MKIDGWIILDKPSGISSAHAVAKVKRLLKPEKIGHAGTLDPLASGVLPLALGEATKTVSYMMDAEKAYSFTVTWGQERDTDDSEGAVVAQSGVRPKKEDILAIMHHFMGKIQQTPPDYSAIKVDGQRAYAMARSGEEVVLKAREVHVVSLEMIEDYLHYTQDPLSNIIDPLNNIEDPLPSPPPLSGRGDKVLDTLLPGRGDFFTPSTALEGEGWGGGLATTSFVCYCGKGTYIRSLARDMGRMLGCFGYISVLRRLKVGGFDESHAISLEQLEEMRHNSEAKFLWPVESALDDILAWDITPDQAAGLRMGRSFHLPNNDIHLVEDSASITLLAKCEGIAVAICSLSQGSVKPVRVFNL